MIDPETGERVLISGELLDEYLAEIRPLRDACDHKERTELRRRQLSDGRSAFYLQCQTCGQATGAAVRQSEGYGAPSWDEELNGRYRAKRTAAAAAVEAKFLKRHREIERGIEHDAKRWQDQYAAYRRTPQWQSKRNKVMQRAGGLCEGCLEEPAVVVHHKGYRNVGDELLFELVALCRACHGKAHPEHHDCFYDNDYSPCESCAHSQEGGAWCGKHEVKAYKAFEVGGPCYPPGTSADPLSWAIEE